MRRALAAVSVFALGYAAGAIYAFALNARTARATTELIIERFGLVPERATRANNTRAQAGSPSGHVAKAGYRKGGYAEGTNSERLEGESAMDVLERTGEFHYSAS